MTQAEVSREVLATAFIRMSSAGKCRRQIGYEVLGYPENDPTPVEGRNVLELGDAAELVLIRRLREEGWLVDLTRWDGGQQLEVSLDNPPRVGHPDGRCRHPELTRNLWVLLECKGMNTYQFQRFLQEGFLRSHPPYLDQVAQYGVALKQAGLVADPCAAVVAALDRDTGRWSYQRVRWEPEVYRRRTEELAEAWTLIARGELPGHDYDGTTWHCSPRYCRWSTLCWDGRRPTPQPDTSGDGVLDGSALEDAARILEAAQVWREGKELEARGKAMQEGAREVFQQALSRHGAKKLAVGGLVASLVTSTRRSWDEKALRRLLTEEQMRQARRIVEVTSLRVVDSGGNTDE
jgi:hypothetical protein